VRIAKRKQGRLLRTSFMRSQPKSSRTSTRDSVTGLMNADAFLAVARHVLTRAKRTGESSLLVCCSLPERFGEAEAARARRLQASARCLLEATRGEDVLGRTGPLELSALLPGAGEDDAELVAERLAALEIAVGFAGAPRGTEEVEALLLSARSNAGTLKLS
jgi:GGDEF domain-containing protein